MVYLKKQPIELELKERIVGTRELLDVLQIIHVMKKANVENTDEYLLLEDLIWKLLDGLHNDKDKCSIKMNNKDLFNVWLCIDNYNSFCTDPTMAIDDEEWAYTKGLLKMFGGGK
jgi:hypothetical protein